MKVSCVFAPAMQFHAVWPRLLPPGQSIDQMVTQCKRPPVWQRSCRTGAEIHPSWHATFSTACDSKTTSVVTVSLLFV